MSGELKVSGLNKSYAKRQADAPAAVTDFSHEFTKGKITSILGPSGSGKSTTLMMIAGLLAPDSGTVVLNGRDLTHEPPENRKCGLVFQNYALFPHLNVVENIEFGLRVRGVSATERRRRAMEMLELVHIPQLALRRAHQLSGGEQQRVALARAVAIKPDVLLMDEPLSALDAKLREDLRAELSRLLRELALTTIYVTHDQAEAMSLGHELIVMNEGRKEQAGLPEDLYRRPATPFVARFLGSANVFAAEVEIVSGRRILNLPGVRIDLNGSSAAAGACWAMIRPEDLEPSAAGAEHFLAAVESTFFHGNSIRLHLRAGGEHWLADVRNETPIASHQPLPLRIRTDKVFVWPRVK